MPDTIVSGHGTRYEAKVNATGRLHTLSVIHTEEHIESINNGAAYFANSADTADTLTVPTGSTSTILYLKNDSSTNNIVIQKMVASADTDGLVLRVMRNMTLGTIGANNSHVPVNSNFGSENTATATCYSWDETGTGMTGLTGGVKWKTFTTVKGPTFYPIDGTIILQKNTSLTVQVTNSTGGDVEFECGFRFYLDELSGD